MAEYETHEHDVLVIGAGGAGLRAAIEASTSGVSVGLVCKSLLGKAHTVMAEGGCAASLGYTDDRDNWKIHFRDTMRGGKMLNNWRMAQLHAQEAAERVMELEEWGALFDRLPDGRISQRNFGGHRYPRLAHIGDRTGLEMIRTLQNHGIHSGMEVYMECTIVELLMDGDKVCGAFGYWRESGQFVIFKAKTVVLATGGIGKAFIITSNSWEYTGDGHALAYRAGAELLDMEFVQFHPTGMIWPLSVRGILVTEGVRGDGGILLNNKNERFMFNYVPEMFAAETAKDADEARRWLDGDPHAFRPPELLTRDVVARSIRNEVREGRGSPHGGAFLNIAVSRDAEFIKSRLPSMYVQFKELGDVDITKEPMEVGPTAHYMMGGIKVDADSAQSTITGLYSAGESAAGMHGANRLGGNSLGDILVFGARAGKHAAEHAKNNPGGPSINNDQVEEIARRALAPFEESGTENPYAVLQDLQKCMEANVGIVRNQAELETSIEELKILKTRVDNLRVEGNRQFNPSWNYALDLRNLITVSQAVALAALNRKESRGGHTREDFPASTDEFEKINSIIWEKDGEMKFEHRVRPKMPDDLKALMTIPEGI